MGIFCEVYLHRPEGGVFKPGDQVKGTVKYAVDETTELKRIVLSVYGEARCKWEEEENKETVTYRNYEELYRIDASTLDGAVSTTLAAGSYQAPFQFTLPTEIPPTHKDRYSQIRHYVRITFERPGMFNWNKIYKTEIIVKGVASANDTEVPVVFGEQKELMNLFSGKSIVNLKSNVYKTAVKPGEAVDLDCEIENQSHQVIKETKIRLVEKITYVDRMGVNKKTITRKIDGCKTDSGAINKSSTAKLRPDFRTPTDVSTIHTKVVKREYFVTVTAKLPFPHINAVLMIPIEIGDERTPVIDRRNEIGWKSDIVGNDDPPPSYWEAMSEDLNDNKICK